MTNSLVFIATATAESAERKGRYLQPDSVVDDTSGHNTGC
jgi:hypothetical protein